MGAVFSMALPIALPDPTGKLVEQKFRLQERGYEGAIGGGGVDILLGYPIWVRYWHSHLTKVRLSSAG